MTRRAARRNSKPKPKLRREAVAASAGSRYWRGVAIAGVVAAFVLAAWFLKQDATVRPADAAWAEAQEALKAGRAGQAERALERAAAINPRDPEPWLLRLEILRVEDRQVDAQRLGWEAYDAVPEVSRRPILRALTLALLADTPEDVARTTLNRWIQSDPEDVDARVALYQRIALSSRSGDPDRGSRVVGLSEIVARHPNHVAAREALVMALADAGESPERGLQVLNAWPESLRDARYDRLKGRWSLEFAPRDDAGAIAAFQSALVELPHDWRTRYRLARALRNAGRRDEAEREADKMERLREPLDPIALGKRLDADLHALDDPKSLEDLADLCEHVGLTRLAQAWRRDASRPSPASTIGGGLSPLR